MIDIFFIYDESSQIDAFCENLDLLGYDDFNVKNKRKTREMSKLCNSMVDKSEDMKLSFSISKCTILSTN